MPSWVRYSVTVYLGLLLAGSYVLSPSATGGSQVQQPRVQPVRIFSERGDLNRDALRPKARAPHGPVCPR